MHCRAKGYLFILYRKTSKKWFKWMFSGNCYFGMIRGNSVITITDYEPFSNLGKARESLD